MIAELGGLARQGKMETTIVLLPAVAESTDSKYWSDSREELRRRQDEQVISEAQTATPAESTSSQSGSVLFQAPKGPIPSCFTSEDSCTSTTGNCSGHGLCQDRYANSDGTSGRDVCYTCHCLSTVGETGSITHWAGSTCVKQDVSVPFWLFAGFILTLGGILWLSVAMLYSVGEEKLPGVIGAGVSRSK